MLFPPVRLYYKWNTNIESNPPPAKRYAFRKYILLYRVTIVFVVEIFMENGWVYSAIRIEIFNTIDVFQTCLYTYGNK